jgi:hypothetical protein
MTQDDTMNPTPHPPSPRRPRRQKRPPDHIWNDGVPTLATLAAPQSLRVYRDRCGDENLPGRFGEIFRHGPDCLAVQFGGVRANGKHYRDPWKVWWRMQQAKRTPGVRLIVEGEEEAIFHCPDTLLVMVADLIGAYRAYGAATRSATLPEAA